MVVLGIDPGYAIVGWGVVDFRNNRHTPLAFGAITTQAQQPFGVRLQSIYDRLMQVMDACHPDFMAIEKLYFQNNQKNSDQCSAGERRNFISGAKKRRRSF